MPEATAAISAQAQTLLAKFQANTRTDLEDLADLASPRNTIEHPMKGPDTNLEKSAIVLTLI